ncbi:MAG TPA: M50 family metallopeptidase [Kofleriaceae bacterium]|nr:M50 family metallopeptidase [Kofleriaceae bacterium]
MIRRAAAALAVIAAAAPAARAEPSDRALVLTGLALAPPTYLVGVSLHEGSHALAALLVGATVDQLHLFPPGRDPSTGTFRFGWTYVRGLRSDGDRLVFYTAPKLTDAALLGGFAALAFTGAWPGNRYGQLALTVFATGLWVDFSKDVVLFAPTNDAVKALELAGLTGWRELPARLGYAGMAIGLGLIVAHGYRRTFDPPPAASAASAAMPRIVPLAVIGF